MMNADTPDVSDGRSGGESAITPQLDATLDLLKNHRRRYVLYYLRDQEGTVMLEELADQVATWESDDGLLDEERVRADLHHSQLPRLDDAGVVTYDPDSGYVTLEDADGTPLTEYLDLAASEENVV